MIDKYINLHRVCFNHMTSSMLIPKLHAGILGIYKQNCKLKKYKPKTNPNTLYNWSKALNSSLWLHPSKVTCGAEKIHLQYTAL